VVIVWHKDLMLMIDENTLSYWGKALASVVAFGVVGAFIDFYVGKPGQRRVRDWLETWWLKFSEFRWGTLGRDEAVFALAIIDRQFGNRLFSARRMTATSILMVLLNIIILVHIIVQYTAVVGVFGGSTDWYSFRQIYFWIFLACLFISATLSFSLTRFASAKIVTILTEFPFLNLFGLLLLVCFQYALLCYWTPTVDTIRYTTINQVAYPCYFYACDYSPFGITEMLSSLRRLFTSLRALSPSLQMHNFVSAFSYPSEPLSVTEVFQFRLSTLLSAFIFVARLSITAIFITSFFLQTLQGPIMTLWARVIESDKPVFTLVFGGAATLAKATLPFPDIRTASDAPTDPLK
jgi:hypothetical protein